MADLEIRSFLEITLFSCINFSELICTERYRLTRWDTAKDQYKKCLLIKKGI